MHDPNLIVIARALHILGGVLWAGFVFIVVLLTAIAARRDPDDRRHLRGLVRGLAPRLMPFAGSATLLTGIYLFVAVHDSDRSLGAYVLGIGALAAILAGVAGSAGAGRASQQLMQLDVAPGQGGSAEIAALEHRVMSAGWLAAAMMAVAVVAMAVARYL